MHAHAAARAGEPRTGQNNNNALCFLGRERKVSVQTWVKTMLWGKNGVKQGPMSIPWPSLYPLWSDAPSILHPIIALSSHSLRLSASPLAGS